MMRFRLLWKVTLRVCLMAPWWLIGHAQSTPSWSSRIQALPQLVPNPVKIIPQEPAAQSSSWGTGFVIAPGYMLTAHHVIQHRKQISVGPVGQTAAGRARWLNAELVKTDPANDLALLKIPENLPALKLNPSHATPIGIEAFVIGYPQPRVQGASRKITSGIVNGYRNTSINQPEKGFLQISAEVSHGNSGGPVIAPDGTVIGMVQRKLNSTRAAEKARDLLINVSYALGSSQIVEFLQSTEAAFQTKSIDLDKTLRPYQIFEMHQHSVLAVIGRGQAFEVPPSDQELPKELP
jgi:S1-C subfamily serine protease